MRPSPVAAPWVWEGKGAAVVPGGGGVNTTDVRATIDVSGGDSTGSGDGEDLDGIGAWLYVTGAIVTNPGSLRATGGDASLNSGVGGDAGRIYLEGTRTFSENAGTVAIYGGEAATPGAHGVVYYDGMNHTADGLEREE